MGRRVGASGRSIQITIFAVKRSQGSRSRSRTMPQQCCGEDTEGGISSEVGGWVRLGGWVRVGGQVGGGGVARGAASRPHPGCRTLMRDETLTWG